MSEPSSPNTDEAIKRLMKEYQMYQPKSFERFDRIVRAEQPIPPFALNPLEEFKREADLLYKQDNYRFKRPAQSGQLDSNDMIFYLYENLQPDEKKQANDYIEDLEIQRLEFFRQNPIKDPTAKYM